MGLYPKYAIAEESKTQLLALMQSDKKNENGIILFSLLKSLGKCGFNDQVPAHAILESLTYYQQL
ncbi:hypothetical protein D9M69_707910 [compost metagenome]